MNFRYGVGSDGAINEVLIPNMYADGNYEYIGRFLSDMIFFLIIKLAILSIVLGIVIDTSAELREQSKRLDDDKTDVCFICGAKRDLLENDNINYEKHIKETHDIWEYCNYLIGLKFVDIQDTNSVNSYVMEQLAEKSISWYPYYVNKELENNTNI